MRPCCGTCGDEMEMHPRAVTLSYLHHNAPADYARAHRYSCASCGYEVFIPFANAFQAVPGEPPDAILVNPKKSYPKPKLP